MLVSAVDTNLLNVHQGFNLGIFDAELDQVAENSSGRSSKRSMHSAARL